MPNVITEPAEIEALTCEVFLTFANLESQWHEVLLACEDAFSLDAVRDRCVDEWRTRVIARLDALLPELYVALALAGPEERAAAAALRRRLLGPWVVGARQRPLARLLAGDPFGAATFGIPGDGVEESPLDVLLREYTGGFRTRAAG